MVDAEIKEAVPLEQANKAFEVGPGVYLTLTREEIEAESAPVRSNRNDQSFCADQRY